MPQPIQLMQGNEACAAGAIAAGARFFAGYPITPSTEIAEELAQQMPRAGGKFIQMEDEIASMAAVIGASLAGKKALTATSGPGFSLMQEMIGYATMTQAPCVVINVMRGGPSTGLPTEASQGDVMQARWGTHGEHSIIALCPNSVEECFTLTVDAFNLAERFRTPVIVLSDAVVGHMREGVTLPLPEEMHVVERKEPSCTPEEYQDLASTVDNILPLPALGSRYKVRVTGLVHDRRRQRPDTGTPEVAQELGMYLRAKIYLHRAEIERVEEVEMQDAEVAILAYGSVSRSAKAAMRWARRQGVKVGVVRPIALWPFPTAAVEQMARQVRTVIVPEMNLGQLSWEVQAAVRGKAEVLELGRVDGKLITPEQIQELIKAQFHYHHWEAS